ncbi:hypothetical protein [Flavobacterium selenitireducens]|uniref:hypothetical protein n=1 Tax=Flavobacterium selenitireducens TaxID=2722704 RepID=UPI00168A9269|nr:hypothetical protein [Flavobacterium selenitireducens]MBD3584113.1 hypothetical protein [Flavobacterium selenitireducens]
MKKQHFIYTTISFILINIWTLYSFFDYYESATKYSTGSITLLFNFLDAVMYSIGIGILLILMRLFYFRKNKKSKLKNNFFYVFAGLFNLNISAIWVISICQSLIKIENESLYFVLGNFTIAIFILFDLYIFNQKENRGLQIEGNIIKS